MKYKLEIFIETKDRITKAELHSYVEEAIERWGGQFHPEDRCFPDNFKEVTVTSLEIEK